MILIEYTTESGAIYTANVIHKKIRRLGKPPAHSQRVKEEWQPYEELVGGRVGESLNIIWGYGKDQYSDSVETIGEGPEENRIRTTITTPVVRLAYPEVIPDAPEE